MIQIEPSPKETLVRDYNGITKKYLHEREISDALLNPAIGSSGWRKCRRRIDAAGGLKRVDPLLFDDSWNHFD